MERGGRILVIRGGAIGDFILTLPVLAALRRQFPEARLEVMGYEHIAALAQEAQLAHAVRSIEARPLAGFFASRGDLAEALIAYFGEFNVIVSYLYDPDLNFQKNVGSCSDAHFIAGPHRPDETLQRHATDCLLEPLKRLAIFEADPVPRLSLSPSSSFRQKEPEGHASLDRLAVHPGSGSERKNWPEERWADLLTRLAVETPWNVLIVGGEAEGDRLERLAGRLPSGRAEVVRGRPLPELAGRLVACSGFMGHDSGISHLAAALRVPSLVLWGETAVDVWRPLGNHVEILHGGAGLRELSVETVFDAIQRREALRRSE